MFTRKPHEEKDEGDQDGIKEKKNHQEEEKLLLQSLLLLGRIGNQIMTDATLRPSIDYPENPIQQQSGQGRKRENILTTLASGSELHKKKMTRMLFWMG